MRSENSLSFFGAGGHSHDGSNSTLIDMRRYSLFDFSLGYKGTQARINAQATNQRAFEEYLIRIVNQQVLEPAGLNLDPNTLNGKVIRANTITSTEIQANTITAAEIQSNTITANQLASNIVLINNIIRSNNFDGTFHSNGVINNTGTIGWAISYAGSSVFNNASIRGRLTAGDIYIPDTASPVFSVTSTGVMTATQGRIGPFTMTSSTFTSETFDPSNWVKIDGTGNGLITVRTWYNDITGFHQARLSGKFLEIDRVDGTGYLYAGVTASNAMEMYITSSPGVASSFYTSINGVTYSSVAFEVPANGNLRTPSFPTTGNATTMRVGTAFGYEFTAKPSSHRDLKNNIEDITDPISIIKKIRPRQFTWKPLPHEGQEEADLRSLDLSYGFIVEEMLEDQRNLLYWEQPEEQYGIGPSSIEDIAKWKPFYWKESDVIAILTASMKEMIKKIENLESRIQDLEGV